jgi:hypothetical protein
LSAFTVIVSTWVVPIGFVAVAGVIWMFAFTQVLFALPLPPAAVFAAVAVARVTVTPLTGMSEAAETTVVPVAAEVIVTWQNAVAPPPTYVHWFVPTKLPGPDTMNAVAVCGPASIVPLSAFTVIVSTWFAPTALVAVAGVIWMFASTQVFEALPLPPEAVFGGVPVVRAIDTPLTGMFDVACTAVVPVAAELIVT